MSATRLGTAVRGIEVVELFPGEAVVRPASFVTTLTFTPRESALAIMLVNGHEQVYGVGEDFTITGNVLNWLSTASFNIEVTDEVVVRYER